MKRASTIGPLAVFCCLVLPAPLFAAETHVETVTKATSSVDTSAPAAKAAALCPADLKAFSGQMEKDGYRVGPSDYGYGYPLGATDIVIQTAAMASGLALPWPTSDITMRVPAMTCGFWSRPPTLSPDTASSNRARPFISCRTF